MWAPTFLCTGTPVLTTTTSHLTNTLPCNKIMMDMLRSDIYLINKRFKVLAQFLPTCEWISSSENLPVLLNIFVLFGSNWRPFIIAVAVLLLLVLRQVTHFIPFAVTKRVNKITEYTMRSEFHQVALLRVKSSGLLCRVLGKLFLLFQKAHRVFISRVKQYKKYGVYEPADSMLLK